MDFFARLGLPASEPWLMQGWFPAQANGLASAFAASGSAGMLRMPAFPNRVEIEGLLASANGLGIDLKGLRDGFNEVVRAARVRGALFLAHGAKPCAALVEALSESDLPRFAFVKDLEEAKASFQAGAKALVVEHVRDMEGLLQKIIDETGLPVIAEWGADSHGLKNILQLKGVRGLQLRSPSLLEAEELSGVPAVKALAALPTEILGNDHPRLPQLKIRNITLEHPLIQGGMGIGVSWERLAGSVAKAGCAGIISAIGTGYHDLNQVKTCSDRPLGAENLHDTKALERIIREANRLSEGRGAVGVNILCAIQGYERMVRASVEAGAKLIISGAGLPLALPEYVGDADVALIPIVSSARALGIICKTWQRKYHRLPDAVVLEGPESGGHQGFTFEQCTDPDFALEKLLPEVVQERDKWGSFPVIVAGGVWDRSDIDRFMALGAGGVQMATRFIGTFECDADQAFKDIILRSAMQDIRLVKSPVGMPGRAVHGALEKNIIEGSAPKVCCISECVTPCERGKGAQVAGYCIADRLADARRGYSETGLHFTGSNGWKLRELVTVRELVGEVTQNF